MEVTMTVSWEIWIQCNNFIFNNVPISFGRWKIEFREVFLLCKYRDKSSLAEDMSSWLASL
jgi:hypothetical protein